MRTLPKKAVSKNFAHYLACVDISRPTNNRNGKVTEGNENNYHGEHDDDSWYCYSRCDISTGARIKLPNSIKAVSPLFKRPKPPDPDGSLFFSSMLGCLTPEDRSTPAAAASSNINTNDLFHTILLFKKK